MDPSTSEALQPGAAYWVNVRQDGTLEMDPTTPKAGQPAPAVASAAVASARAKGAPQAAPASAVRLVVSDEAGRQATRRLLPDLSAEARARTELPPRFPGDVFDVRFSTGTTAAPLSEESTPELQGTRGPVTLRAAALADGRLLHVTTPNGTVDARLTPEAPSIQLPAGVPSVTMRAQRAPSTTRLAKSYPNPATTTATVEYALAEAANVTVRLYDVLGRRIATLVDGAKRAGVHQTRVDASTLDSGVYFLRLRTGDTMHTQRLTVVR